MSPLFAGCESTDAGVCQPEHSKPSHCVAQCNKSFPVKLGYVALGVALTHFKQGIELFGAQLRRSMMDHLA
jgi:hypothetical protein